VNEEKLMKLAAEFKEAGSDILVMKIT